MSVEDDHGTERKNLLEQLLAAFRERYQEEHGEEPPEELMTQARNEALSRLAKERRDANRSIYDALADE